MTQSNQAKTPFEEWIAAHANDSNITDNAKDILVKLADKGLPTRRTETYKYTDLKALLKKAPKTINPLIDVASLEQIIAGNAVQEATQIIVANGNLIQANEAKGIVVSTRAPSALPNLPEGTETDTALLLASSLASQEISLNINSDAANAEKPIEIILIGSGDDALITNKLAIEVSGDQSPEIIMTYLTSANPTIFSFVECHAKSGEVSIIKRQKQGAQSAHFETFVMSQTSDATLKVNQLNLGAHTVRNGLYSCFNGEATAHLDLSGVTIANEKAHIDTTLVVDHAVANCTSEERFKNAIGGQAKSVFQGKIIVQPDAQKTDARMMCQSLLLSEDASVDVKPELEIFADDVQCGHGATIGEMDEDLLFYLKSRGLPEKDAKRMLILAFLSENLEELEEGIVKSTLQQDIDDYLNIIIA